MALLDIRDLVIKHTGRVDLINEDGSDNGMNAIINAAQDVLEMNFVHPKMKRRRPVSLAASGYKVDVPRCISMEEVWIFGTMEGSQQRRKLEIKAESWLRANYSEAYSAITVGTPFYCAPLTIGVDDSLYADPLTGLSDVADLMSGNHFTYNGLLVLPPADAVYTLTIYGLFLSKKLALDTDINYWTENHPMALVMATALMMEGLLRNTEGIRAWNAALEPYIGGIDKSAADAEGGAHINQMEG